MIMFGHLADTGFVYPTPFSSETPSTGRRSEPSYDAQAPVARKSMSRGTGTKVQEATPLLQIRPITRVFSWFCSRNNPGQKKVRVRGENNSGSCCCYLYRQASSFPSHHSLFACSTQPIPQCSVSTISSPGYLRAGDLTL